MKAWSSLPPAGILAALAGSAGAACTALIGAEEPDEIFDSGASLEATVPKEAGVPDVRTPPSEADTAVTCPTGETMCSGRCVDEQTDTNNCGGCGLVCPSPCTAGRCIVTLATGSFVPVGLAVDETSVYWANAAQGQNPDPMNGSVMKVSTAGGPVTALALGQQPRGMAADATNVYWTNIEEERGVGWVMSTPKSGAGAPVTIANSGPGVPGGIAIAAGRVFWTFGGNVAAATFDGGFEVVALGAPGYGEFNPTIAGTPATLYSSTGGGCVVGVGPSPGDDLPCYEMVAVPTDGGPALPLFPSLPGATQSPAFGLAIDATNVYWSANGFCSSGCGSAVLKGPLSGGTPVTLDSPVSGQSPIAVDEASVYFTTMGCPSDAGPCVTYVTKVGLDGGAVTTLATSSFVPVIAVDATSVYWINPTGVMKVTPK